MTSKAPNWPWKCLLFLSTPHTPTVLSCYPHSLLAGLPSSSLLSFSPTSMEGVGWCFYDTKWLCYFSAGILGWLRFVPRIGRENPWKGLPGQTAACFPSWFCDSHLLAHLPLIPASLRGFLACDRAFLPEDFRTAVHLPKSNLPTFRFNVISSRRLLPLIHLNQGCLLCSIMEPSFPPYAPCYMQVLYLCKWLFVSSQALLLDQEPCEGEDHISFTPVSTAPNIVSGTK